MLIGSESRIGCHQISKNGRDIVPAHVFIDDSIFSVLFLTHMMGLTKIGI
jgi:hypothetical protein